MEWINGVIPRPNRAELNIADLRVACERDGRAPVDLAYHYQIRLRIKGWSVPLGPADSAGTKMHRHPRRESCLGVFDARRRSFVKHLIRCQVEAI